MKRATWAALTLVLASCAVGETSDPIHSRQEAVTKGTPSPGDASVVALVTRPQLCGATVTTATCTGTLISDRAVLTAGHCADETVAYVVESGVAVGAATNTRRRVIKAVKHPQYQRDTSDFDIAVVWLDAPLPGVPVALPDAGTKAPVAGEALRIVGFGQTRDAAEPEGTKREGSVTVSSVSPHTIDYAASPSMSCQGDSGGPVSSKVAGVERLVGVVSAGDKDCRKSGVAARVDAVLADFILPTLAQQPPSGVSGVELSCTATCERDQDCRPGLVCRQARDGANRCALSGFEPGELKADCASDADCGKGASCATTYDGCQCYQVCPGPPEPEVVGPDPKAASSAANRGGELEGGCGVAAPGSIGPGGWAALLLGSIQATRRLTGGRRRRR